MKIERKFRSLVVATALFGMSTTAIMAGDELIQNGSFENFSINKDNGKSKLVQFDNWSENGEVWNHEIGKVATEGTYKAELDMDKNSVNSLTQTISTVADKTYLLSLDAYARKAGTSDFELLVDGESIGIITPDKDWDKYGIEFTGKGGEQTISIKEIASQNNGLGAIIDNISVLDGISLDKLKAEDRAIYEIMEPTGLDQILEIIDNDRLINSKVTPANIIKAKDAVIAMNSLIKEAIVTLGLANDGVISIADTMEINRYLVETGKWSGLRADYSLIETSSDTVAITQNAIKNLWGRIYNLGFNTTNKNRDITDINGKKSTSFATVGYYLGTVVKDDITNGSLNNPDFQEIQGTTGTKLDMMINVILTDRGLLKSVPTSDLRAGADNANKMNHLIIKAIKTEGLGNDGKLTTADIRTINNYLVANYLEEWAELHGDDEKGEETGYHRVQNDGATTRIYADNVMNSIADGIYHLGYATNDKNRLLNEDGNKNKSFEKVAWWLDSSLKSDLQAGKFNNLEYKETVGATGTFFDKMIPYIYNDEGLLLKVSMEDIREGARTANEMNKLLVEAIKITGVASDDYISAEEVKILNKYLVDNHESTWAQLHGDDEKNAETGYHRIQNDGAVGIMHNKNTINNLADGIYHLGFPTRFTNNLENEDGNKNVTFTNVAYWLNQSLQADYTKGVFK